ncbi:hypothetical protein [Stigmatella erecta]|uniref:Uncharacterized protein n=1 Tax=Stigmatella erecta TaxID=83460 RepID=A0A1I0LA44_9BACT|nr:hypothetical protein [Stigmatella erecta]SEU36995.1 hypothetical protein SAMN05443639_12332 [Stigmatella erecta]
MNPCVRCGKPVGPGEDAWWAPNVHRACETGAAPAEASTSRLLNVRAVSLECMPLFRAVAQVRLAVSHLAQSMAHMERARRFLGEVLGKPDLDVAVPRLALSAYALDVAVMRVGLESAAQDLEHEAEAVATKGDTT